MPPFMQRSMNISPIRCTQSYAINIITLKLCFVFYKVQIIILNVALAIKGAILSVVREITPMQNA